MTHKEIIYQAIGEICNTDNPQRFAEMNKTVFEVAKKALELSQPPLSSNLDEAAQEYTEKGNKCQDEMDAFIAGADWQYQKDRYEFAKLKMKEWSDGFNDGSKRMAAKMMAEQGKEAKATIGYYNQCGLSILTEPSIKKIGFKEGDKVIVQIRKAE